MRMLWTLALVLSVSVSTSGQDLNTKLLESAKAGNTTRIEKLIAVGADPNTRDKDGWTAVMWAASLGRSDAVRALLDRGADANAEDKNGWTALMGAAIRGYSDTVRTLSEHGADLNAKDKNGWTALISAAAAGQVDTVRILLAEGANINSRDKDGDTALLIAKKRHHEEIVAILDNPPGIPQGGNPGQTTSGSLVPGESQVLTKKLIDAAEAGDSVEVRKLLSQGADANGRGSYGHTALMGAAARGNADVVKTLLERGAAVNVRGDKGGTALMEAAYAGYADVVRLLSEKGADVNAKDDGGWTALFWAVISRRTNAVLALLEKGADPNVANKHSDTPLLRAAYEGDPDMVSLLLQNGAYVNAKDDLGRTALIEATWQGHIETVRTLLRGGADVHVQDRDGNTALSVAEKCGYAEVAALLKNTSKIPQSGQPEKAAPQPGEASPVFESANSTNQRTGDEVLDKDVLTKAFFRLGYRKQIVDSVWSRQSDLAAGFTSDIRHDLLKIGAPKNLVELASQTQMKLKVSPVQDKQELERLIFELGRRLDEFCKSQPEENFFYAAGGFTYRIDILGEDLIRPGNAEITVEARQHDILPLANSLVAQCSASETCKVHLVSYFSDIAIVLKKAQLIPSDGLTLARDSAEIESAFSR